MVIFFTSLKNASIAIIFFVPSFDIREFFEKVGNGQERAQSERDFKAYSLRDIL